MKNQKQNKTVAPIPVANLSNNETQTQTRGRKKGVGNFVTISLSKLTSLVGGGNVVVRRGWLEGILESQARQSIDAQINALSESTPKEKIEMKIEE